MGLPAPQPLRWWIWFFSLSLSLLLAWSPAYANAFPTAQRRFTRLVQDRVSPSSLRYRESRRLSDTKDDFKQDPDLFALTGSTSRTPPVSH